MVHKALNFAMIVAIVIGGVLAWRTGEERSRLTSAYRRLAQITGDFPIADPSKAYFLALDTEEPLHFAWRIYLPPNYSQVLKYNDGGQHSSWATGAVQTIARVRLRENDQGQFETFTHFSGGSSRMSFGDKALADLLRDRWDDVRVEQLGADGLATVDPDQPAVLLRLTLPDSMLDEARSKLESYTVERYVPVLFELTLDPSAPKP